MGLESSSSYTEVIARQLLIFNRVIPIDEMVERIENVSRDDVLQTAQKILSTAPTYALVGDIKNHFGYEKIQEMLK